MVVAFNVNANFFYSPEVGPAHSGPAQGAWGQAESIWGTGKETATLHEVCRFLQTEGKPSSDCDVLPLLLYRKKTEVGFVFGTACFVQCVTNTVLCEQEAW